MQSTTPTKSTDSWSIFEPPNCEICIQPLTEDLVATPCGHVFHKPCVKEYVEHAKKCPKDRKECQPDELIDLFFSMKET